MAMPVWLAEALGLLGAVCFAAMLMPQVRLNWRNQSTKGMSKGLIILWHLAAVLCAAYYALDVRVNFFPILSMVCMCFICAIIEAQAVLYAPGRPPATGCRLAALSLAFFAASGAVVAACLGVFRAASVNAAYVLGNILPSALMSLGFLPQMHEFVSSRSIKGYSFGVTALDLVGSSANTAVLFAPANVQPTQALKEALPFLSIIAMHVLLIAIAVAIVLWERAAAAGELCDGKSCGTESAAESPDRSTAEGSSDPASGSSESEV